MNTNQYTQKTLEALQAAQQLAVEYQHNALEPEHLLHALATQEQGLIPQLLQKLNVDAGSFSAAVAEKLSAMPRVSGSGRDPDKVYISQATDKVLSAAAREAKAMKDDYVSVEHISSPYWTSRPRTPPSCSAPLASRRISSYSSSPPCAATSA